MRIGIGLVCMHLPDSSHTNFNYSMCFTLTNRLLARQSCNRIVSRDGPVLICVACTMHGQAGRRAGGQAGRRARCRPSQIRTKSYCLWLYYYQYRIVISI